MPVYNIENLRKHDLAHSQDYCWKEPIKEGNLYKLKELLQSKNIAAKEVKLSDARTLLHIAALEGRTEIMQFLLNSGVDISARDSNNEVPLHYAVAAKHEAPGAVRLLLAQPNVDWKIQCKMEDSLFDLALYRMCVEPNSLLVVAEFSKIKKIPKQLFFDALSKLEHEPLTTNGTNPGSALSEVDAHPSRTGTKNP